MPGEELEPGLYEFDLEPTDQGRALIPIKEQKVKVITRKGHELTLWLNEGGDLEVYGGGSLAPTLVVLPTSCNSVRIRTQER